jgi:ActR/RegA family two-component response regulator
VATTERIEEPALGQAVLMQPGRRTVLLVEDEESITAPLSDALTREGFDTEVARTAGEALALQATRASTSCCWT